MFFQIIIPNLQRGIQGQEGGEEARRRALDPEQDSQGLYG
jgi:hypothetical protein